MLSPLDYDQLLRSHYRQPEVITVPVADAIGAQLHESVLTSFPQPRFTNSAMDGFAMRMSTAAEALAGGRAITVAGDTPAGGARHDVAGDVCVRVMTGAPVPASAEVVIPVEYTSAEPTGPAPDSITLRSHANTNAGCEVNEPSLGQRLRPGLHIRAAGEELQAGQTLLAAGSRLGPGAIGLLAAAGIETVQVYRHRLTVGVVVTGAELVAAGVAPQQSQVLNSNLTMIRAALALAGHQVIGLTVGDDVEQLTQTLDSLTARADIIVTTGGVSAGAYEVVKQTLAGPAHTFTRIALQPGGPQGHGMYQHTPVLNFPGNPAAALVSFHLFGTSLITGVPLDARLRTTVYQGPEVATPLGRTRVLPGQLEPAGVRSLGGHKLRFFALANALILSDPAAAVIRPGDMVRYLPVEECV